MTTTEPNATRAKVTPRIRPDGRIARRVLLPTAVALEADRLAGSQRIEAFSALVNGLVEARLADLEAEGKPTGEPVPARATGGGQ